MTHHDSRADFLLWSSTIDLNWKNKQLVLLGWGAVGVGLMLAYRRRN